AAAAANGDLLVVIADDLFPPHGWDRTLTRITGRLDPARTPFVVKVADSPNPRDVLLRHPVVSRSFYAKFGLFSPSYRGVYCDTDFTTRAYWCSVILDGRSLRLEHRHPELTEEVAPSESHDRMNRLDEYERGVAQYVATWSWRKQRATVRIVPASAGRRWSHWGLFMTQRRFRASSNIRYAGRVGKNVARSLSARCSCLTEGFCAHSDAYRKRVAQILRRRLVLRRIVRRHPELTSFFLVNAAATRGATLSETIGDVVTMLERRRQGAPALVVPTETSASAKLAGAFELRWASASVEVHAPWEESGAGHPRLRILVVDPLLPAYDRAAGSLRLFRILGLLREAGHHVTFVARDGSGQERYKSELEAMGIEVHAGDPERFRRQSVTGGAAALDLVSLLRHGRFDVAWLDFYELAEQYLPTIRAHAPSTRILIDTVDVHWLRQKRQAEIQHDARRRRQARTTRLREETVYRAADGLIAVTADDERALRELAPEVPTYVLGTVHPAEEPGPGFDLRSGVVFVGNFNHSPNVDAALYLVREVMPLVWASCPAMALTIVGTNPPPNIVQLAGRGVTVTGHVSHTRPYLDAARVSVAPLRFGAGIKGKVGEAFAAGLPVVTTPIGAEGMGLEDGVHALIADTAAELAASIVRLHTDSELWMRLSEGGRLEAERRYGADAARSRLAHLLDTVMSRTVFIWIPDWDDEVGIDDVLGSYAGSFTPQDPVALVVGVDAADGSSSEKAVASLAAS